MDIICPVCNHPIDKHMPNSIIGDAGCYIIVNGSVGTFCDCQLLPSDIVRLYLESGREALAPFAHPDLCESLGGNIQGEKSIIFQRNHAIITLEDTRRAAAWVDKYFGKKG